LSLFFVTIIGFTNPTLKSNGGIRMTTVEKIFETITADLNQENSRIIAVFHKLTVLLFTGVVSLAVLLFLLFF